MMSGTTVTCKNCGNSFTGKYCNNCGEKVYDEHDKSVLHFFEEGLHFITHFEGTLFTTIKTMFRRPGQLSFDYCEGKRKKYFKPLSFFLLLVVLYLLFPFFEGLNMRLQYYSSQPLYGKYAAAKIQAVAASTGLPVETLAEKFHQKGEKASKFLLIVIVPLTAMVMFCMAFFRRKYFFDHMVFAAEVNSFYLLWGFLLLPLLVMIVNMVAGLFGIQQNIFTEEWIGILMYLYVTIYVAKAAKKFYNFKWWQSFLFTVVFCFAHIFIVYILYKFLLFVTVINQIH